MPSLYSKLSLAFISLSLFRCGFDTSHLAPLANPIEPSYAPTLIPGAKDFSTSEYPNGCGVHVYLTNGIPIPTHAIGVYMPVQENLGYVNISEKKLASQNELLEALGVDYYWLSKQQKLIEIHEFLVHPCQKLGFKKIIENNGTQIKIEDLAMFDIDNMGRVVDSTINVTISEGITQLETLSLFFSNKTNVADIERKDLKELRNILLEKYYGLGRYAYESSVNFLFLMYSDDELYDLLQLTTSEDIASGYDPQAIENAWSMLLRGHSLDERIHPSIVDLEIKNNPIFLEINVDEITYGQAFHRITLWIGQLPVLGVDNTAAQAQNFNVANITVYLKRILNARVLTGSE